MQDTEDVLSLQMWGMSLLQGLSLKFCLILFEKLKISVWIHWTFTFFQEDQVAIQIDDVHKVLRSLAVLFVVKCLVLLLAVTFDNGSSHIFSLFLVTNKVVPSLCFLLSVSYFALDL